MITGMVDMMSLWDEFHDAFDTNDGSLPEIDIENVSPDGIAAMWMYLRSRAFAYVGDAWFWHTITQQATPLDSASHAAQLVVTGEAQPFHTILQGITYSGAVIPDLGVFIFPGAIVLDYRKGSNWDAARLTALFELLRQLQSIDPDASISLSKTFFSSKWQAQFATAFARYTQQMQQRK
jgi:hypothetical protein